jgi:hypothetical protein
MHRTVPQIIMLNHAAWREQKNAEIRGKAKAKKKEQEDNDPILPGYGGLRKSELEKHPEQWARYYSSEID